MKPLVSYYGGKQRLASRIVAMLPPHTVYCEPYAGGAAVFWAKGIPGGSTADYREVLNDHDDALITMYRCAQDPMTRQALKERLTYTPMSRAEWQRAKMILKEPEGHDVVSRAWAQAVKIRQSFSYIAHGGWSIGVYGGNAAATWASWRHGLDDIFARLERVSLECREALAVIKHWDSPQTCFYVDPPYPGTNQGDYKGFTLADWDALVEVLEHCQGSVVLSCYAQPRELQGPGWERIEIAAYCSASPRGKTNGHDRRHRATKDQLGQRQRTEVIWRIDRSHAVRTELAWMRTPQGCLFEDTP